jgi:hypothetical protein
MMGCRGLRGRGASGGGSLVCAKAGANSIVDIMEMQTTARPNIE